MHGIWVWRRWTRWHLTPAILVVAALVLALDVVTAWRGVALGSLGRIGTSPALPLGILLACMSACGASGSTAPTSSPGASSSW